MPLNLKEPKDINILFAMPTLSATEYRQLIEQFQTIISLLEEHKAALEDHEVRLETLEP